MTNLEVDLWVRCGFSSIFLVLSLYCLYPLCKYKHILLGIFLYDYLYGKSEVPMNEETFYLSIRKFLKLVGVNSQRHRAGTESFPATVTLEVAGLKLNVKFDRAMQITHGWTLYPYKFVMSRIMNHKCVTLNTAYK